MLRETVIQALLLSTLEKLNNSVTVEDKLAVLQELYTTAAEEDWITHQEYNDHVDMWTEYYGDHPEF